MSSFQVDVTVTAVSTTSARARARLLGHFYNTGALGGGDTGQVYANIEIRTSGSGLQVVYWLGECHNPDCSDFTDLIFATLGPVNLGETHTLSLAWDGTRFFTFGFDEVTAQVDAATLPVAGPSKFPFKVIRTRVSGIDGPNEGAHIKATFDNVHVNGVLYDDFTSTLIDRTKWRFFEFVSRVENGVFKSELTRFGANGSNNLNFADTAGVNAYQADVTVTEVNLSSATARARLSGFFYNNGTPGGGDVGEVHAEIAIFDSGSGLRVWYLVVQCNNPDCSSFTFLIFDDTTFGTVNLGETHTLSLAWDGKRFFTFGFDGNTVKFDAAAAPVVGPSKSSFNVNNPDNDDFGIREAVVVLLSHKRSFRADTVLALFSGPRPLSEGANSGPDQL